MRGQTVMPAFEGMMESLVAALRNKQLNGTREIIAQMMAMNMDAPEPHNLLGIHNELLGDYQAARRHYRAAYALDPTYKPCCRNLERITSYNYSTAISDMDFGMVDKTHRNEGAKSEPHQLKQLG